MSRSQPWMQEQQSNSSIYPRDQSWFFWFTVPLYPYGRRQTLRNEVVKGRIWTFDQTQGILYVVVPIRMTVVKLEAGGLLVYAPIAPTAECIRLVEELVAAHGEVKYIILPTVSGLEHKVFVGPFARRFPRAQVFVAPNQWSFPLNLPLSWLGLPPKRTYILPEDSSQTPFAAEFDYAILGPISLGIGPFEEVVFLHKQSRTLLVVDCVLSIPEDPPAIVELDPYPLLFHARDDLFDRVEDSEATRRRGWQRISLFAFYFRPSALSVVDLGQTLRNALKAPDRSRKAYFGLFPFKWKANWKSSFDALRSGGRLLVAPILQTLIFNRAPKETIAWADKIMSWDFQRIIPCHFDAPIEAGPRQLRQAFAFLEKEPAIAESSSDRLLPQEDFEFLKEIERTLDRLKITPPAKEKV